MNVAQNHDERPSRVVRSLRSAHHAASPLDASDPVSGILSEASSVLGIVCDALELRHEADRDDKQASDLHALLVALQARLGFAHQTYVNDCEDRARALSAQGTAQLAHQYPSFDAE